MGNRSVFQAPQLEANAELFGQLQTLEAELLEKQTLLKPNDDSIRRLTRQRQSLIAYINKQTIGLLEGELATAQSQLTSLSRPVLNAGMWQKAAELELSCRPQAQ